MESNALQDVDTYEMVEGGEVVTDTRFFRLCGGEKCMNH